MKRDFYVKREIEKSILAAAKQFPAIAVTGPRQAGKSTLLKHLFSKTHKYLTLDDPLLREKAISDPEFFLDEAGEAFILDEIQYVPQIMSYIKIRIDNDREKKGRFIFTGSQQFNLIKGLSESLAGRIALFDLLPFSVYEKKNQDSLKKTDFFVDACLNGSYPELFLMNKKDVSIWYASYLQTYLERDVRMISDIGNLRDFQRLIRLLAARCSQILNMSDISSELGVSVNTVKKWISILEASKIVYLLCPYYRNMGKRVTKSPKIYFYDCGLVCYLTGIENRDVLLKGPLCGALYENFCVQEMLKVIYNHVKNVSPYYLRTQNNLEIDILVEKDLSVYPFEIKHSKTLKFDMAKPIDRFTSIFSAINVNQGNIISPAGDKGAISRSVRSMSVESFLDWVKNS